MDRQRVRERENQCIQEQPPTCTAACPIHVDARGMIECIRKQDFSAAFAIFNRFVPFPRIISRICDHPCEAECKRYELGGEIRINALERACVDYSTKRSGGATFSSRKSARIAVVGGGLSGLTAAFDLITKGFQVVLFEAGRKLAGRLRELGEGGLPLQWIDEDLAVFENVLVEVHLNTRVGGHAQTGPSLSAVIEEFDAVYLGLGPASAACFEQELALLDDGRIAIEALTFATSNPKVFAGGSQRYGSTAYSAHYLGARRPLCRALHRAFSAEGVSVGKPRSAGTIQNEALHEHQGNRASSHDPHGTAAAGLRQGRGDRGGRALSALRVPGVRQGMRIPGLL